jgi:hypothetical protein
MWVLCSYAHQKRALDSITDGCEPPCGCWELNLGPLEEQLVLLTAEPSLQHHHHHSPSFFILFLSYLLRQHLSLNLELTISVSWLARESLGTSCLCPSSFGFTYMVLLPAFMWVLARNLNPGPHTSTESHRLSPSKVFIVFPTAGQVCLCNLGGPETHSLTCFCLLSTRTKDEYHHAHPKVFGAETTPLSCAQDADSWSVLPSVNSSPQMCLVPPVD